jgi:hypothetical protein
MPEDILHPIADPAEFDFDAFLQDAKQPEESVTVYKRADVISELSDLKRRIELEARVNADERSAGDSALTPLEKEYEALLQTFSQSGLTVYVRALSDLELREQREQTEKRTQDMPPQKANVEFGYDLLAAAIIAVKPAGGERTPVKFNRDKVEALRRAIGETQVGQILEARQIAQNAVPTVDADFLRKPSGSETGQE